ncbi:MAG: tRNA (adenosine(37)-N6)-threonylcarbamoyltransferase complex ATPase subunit type 1 TsaE, partial [Clostridia bacterium]|nr:tRNA (adenosine(37)-N6)-threonylcarbamoyltransferase complex ATPase subunit type 1 TsaE [Clostridia bacterium]
EVVAYFGGLGAGKTCFTAGLARGLGVVDDVHSPTFAIVNEYRGEIPLCHFDMYRVTTFDSLCSTGFFDYLDGSRVLAVEWSENIENALPAENVIRIQIERGAGDNERILQMTGDEAYENSWR